MRIIYSLIFLITVVGCKKNEDHIEPPIEIEPSILFKDSFYFKGTLNGADISWLVPSHKNESSFTYHAGASLGHTDFSSECLNGYCYYVNASTEIKTNVANINPHIAVSINMAVPAYTRDIALSWFVPGPKTYPTSVRTHDKPDLLDPAKNGVVVYYVDQNGTSWSSNRGNQQGSSFESISFNNEPRTDVAHEKVWKAKFSCTLYSNAGNSIKVENAEIYGPILLPKGGNNKQKAAITCIYSHF